MEVIAVAVLEELENFGAPEIHTQKVQCEPKWNLFGGDERSSTLPRDLPEGAWETGRRNILREANRWI